MIKTEDKINDTMESVLNKLNSVDIDDLKVDGFQVRSGSKILKFTVQEEIDCNIEDDIRAELKEKLSKRLMQIGKTVKQKLDEMSDFVSTVKNEYESKKVDLDRKLNSANLMPDITYQHTKQGLSLSKGYDDGRLLWLMQAVYWPKYINDRIIDPKYSRRLIHHVLICVETMGDKVMNVTVKKPIGLDHFQHYHHNCWGGWVWPKKWETPDDIIDIAKQAEIVLETVNMGSLASQSPRGLMRASTLEKHSEAKKQDDVDLFSTSNKKSDAIGINDNFQRDNIWST
jgi:hypothetical protein